MVKRFLFNALLFIGKKQQAAGLDVERSRKSQADFMKIIKLMTKVEKGFEVEKTTRKGLDDYFVPKTESANKLIVFLHGGGFLWGMEHLGAMYNTFVSRLAYETGSRVHTLDYRLIPENKMPCGLEDCDVFYQSFLDEGVKPEDIIFVGDSAGGDLVLALSQRLVKQGRPLPKAIVSISAVTDCSMKTGSRVSKADEDPIFHKATIDGIMDLVAQSIDLKNPEASPLHGDFKGLPPLLFTVGGREMLLDDTLLAHKKAQDAGVDTQLEVSENMMHDYPLFSDIFPEGREGLNIIVSFIKEHQK